MTDISKMKEAYRDAAREVMHDPIFFIDSLRYSGDPEQDKQILRDQFQEQFPGKNMVSLKHFSEDRLVSISMKGKPWAISSDFEAQGICVINEIDLKFRTKEDILKKFYGEDAKLLPVPGKDEDYARFLGHHEAAHCKPPASNIKSSHVTIQKRETFADFVALNRTIDPSVAKAMFDARKFQGISDPLHATSVLLDPENIPNGIEEEHVQAASRASAEMTHEMRRELGLSEDDFYTLHEDNPEAFYNVVETMVNQGRFSQTPLIEAHIRGHMESAKENLDLVAMGKNYPDVDLDAKAHEYIKTGKVLDTDGVSFREKTGDPLRDGNGALINTKYDVLRQSSNLEEPLQLTNVQDRLPFNTDHIKVEKPSTGQELQGVKTHTPSEFSNQPEASQNLRGLDDEFDTSVNPKKNPTIVKEQQNDVAAEWDSPTV